MKCMECGAIAKKGFTTSVTELGDCVTIVRYVPCYKCTECNEIIYTAEVVKQLEEIAEAAKKQMQEIAVHDYTKWQREYFDAKTPEEISKEAFQFEKAHPYIGNAQRL